MARLTGESARGWIADHFAKYAEPNFLGRMLMRYELFKRVVGVHGSIIECGIKTGDGLLQWYQISRLLEPLARRRIVYGFDTLAGLASVDPERDGAAAVPGAQPTTTDDTPNTAFEEITRCIELAHHRMVMVDLVRSTQEVQFRHPWKQIELVKGDFMDTGEPFVAAHPHLVVALLYLDFDIYAPTKRAIELFLPRMPKGAILAFDELDHADWPGETAALMDTIGVRNLRIERLPWEQSMGFAVLE